MQRNITWVALVGLSASVKKSSRRGAKLQRKQQMGNTESFVFSVRQHKMIVGGDSQNVATMRSASTPNCPLLLSPSAPKGSFGATRE